MNRAETFDAGWLCRGLMGLLLFAPLSDAGETKAVRLRNGNVLTGVVTEAGDDQVTIDIPEVGALTFERSDILSIEEAIAKKPADAPEPPARPDAASTADDPMTQRLSSLVAKAARRVQAAQRLFWEAQAAAVYPPVEIEGYRVDLWRERAARNIRTYEEAEREAQRALDYYLRHGPMEQAEAMRALIHQCRQEISEIESDVNRLEDRRTAAAGAEEADARKRIIGLPAAE